MEAINLGENRHYGFIRAFNISRKELDEINNNYHNMMNKSITILALPIDVCQIDYVRYYEVYKR